MPSQTKHTNSRREKKHSKSGVSVKESARGNNYMENNLINMGPNCSVEVPFTKELFLENYSKGKWNLSTIPCPECLQDTSFLKAPEAFNEVKRLKVVDQYIDLPHWGRYNRFSLLLKKMTKLFGCRGASISLVNSRFQVIKFQVGLGFSECSRQVSLDSHAILSSIFFMILDASKDWRTESNPLVKGVPNIKFYLGVPLISNATKEVIGVLSIFDPFPRQKVEEATIMIMKKMASEVMNFLDAPLQNTGTGGVCKSSIEVNATSKLLASSITKSDVNNKENSSDPRMDKIEKLLERYGRATSIDSNNSKIIFERDGSGTAYQHHSMLKFNKYSSPYSDLIDFEVWNELTKCTDIKSGSQKLCSMLMAKLNYDCFYIVNVRTTEMKRIKLQYFPDRQEIEIDNYKFQNKLETVGKEYIKMKFIGLDSKVKGINDEWALDFHKLVEKSENGLIYRNEDDFKYQFKRGVVLPFYRSPNKLTRRKRVVNKTNDKLGLYLKHNAYMIGGFSKYGRDLTINEIGYIYGCASLLRRIYL